MTQPSPSDIAAEVGIVGGPIGTQSGEPTTLLAANDIINRLKQVDKDTAYKQLVDEKAKYMTESARLRQSLASQGVVFDSGKPVGVYVDGVFRTFDEARAEGHQSMSNIDRLMQQYNAVQANIDMLDSLENDLFDTDYKWADPSSAVNAYLNSQEEFRKRVKFYIDAAKDFIQMESDELKMNQDAAKRNAELLQKQKELGISLPGLGIRTWTPGPSMTTQAKMMAGFPVGNQDSLLTNQPGAVFESPEEWARAAGVPGYAGGTKMQEMTPRQTVRADRPPTQRRGNAAPRRPFSAIAAGAAGGGPTAPSRLPAPAEKAARFAMAAPAMQGQQAGGPAAVPTAQAGMVPGAGPLPPGMAFRYSPAQMSRRLYEQRNGNAR